MDMRGEAMYKIGDFSKLSKTTIKTLRYYEQEHLLIPSYIDEANGYRFYEAKDLLTLSKIISFRQIGLSIEHIRRILAGEDAEQFLKIRKLEIEKEQSTFKDQLSKIKFLLEGKEMNYEAIIKDLPEITIYYKEGIIKDYSEITSFILQSAEECSKTNPNLKCVTPDYSYINYLDGEYKEKNIAIRYAQAVTQMGTSNETIQFADLEPVKAVCIYHKGAYENLGQAYSFIMKWIEENHYQITDLPRERYIDGIWNKDNVEDWVTEIQVPIKK